MTASRQRITSPSATQCVDRLSQDARRRQELKRTFKESPTTDELTDDMTFQPKTNPTRKGHSKRTMREFYADQTRHAETIRQKVLHDQLE